MSSSAYPLFEATVESQLVRSWRPGGPARAEVVLVHGIAEHSGRYQQAGALLASAGLGVTAFDLIGFGATGGRRGDVKDWAHYLDQVEGHLVTAGSGGVPVVLMGHSMGGLICLEYALAERPRPSLLVLSSPALGGGTAWQRSLAGLAGRLLPWLSLPIRIDGSQLSRDPQVGERYHTDPLVHTRSTTRLGAELFAAMARTKAAMPRLDVPTLVFQGGADSVVSPRLTRQLGTLPGVDRALYPGLRHETLNEPEGGHVVADVLFWIETHLS